MRRLKHKLIILVLVMMFSILEGSGGNFFWKSVNNNVTVYFCGSMHLLKPEVYPLRKDIEEAFASSDYLVVEFDMSKIDMTKLQELIRDKGMYNDERTLKSEMPADYYSRLEKEMEKYGKNMETFKTQKPWYMTMTLASIQVISLGYTPEAGLDLYFIQKAEDKEILPLETPESQLELLSGIPEKMQMDYLLQSVDEIDEFQENIEILADTWEKGDEVKMYDLMCAKMKNKPELTEYYDLLFTDRNLEMTNKIELYLKGKEEKVYFVVAGTGHFLGQEGIIELLRNRGYEIERK